MKQALLLAATVAALLCAFFTSASRAAPNPVTTKTTVVRNIYMFLWTECGCWCTVSGDLQLKFEATAANGGWSVKTTVTSLTATSIHGSLHGHATSTTIVSAAGNGSFSEPGLHLGGGDFLAACTFTVDGSGTVSVQTFELQQLTPAGCPGWHGGSGDPGGPEDAREE